ncbi:hypothetical protein L1M59_30590 [Bacillus sp. ET1]|nr:hypothetical protein [Bacillus sp. ET1]
MQQEMNELQRDIKYQVEVPSGRGKVDKESKIMMKKDAIPLSNESIQLYKHEQKRLQQKLRKLNEKQ